MQKNKKIFLMSYPQGVGKQIKDFVLKESKMPGMDAGMFIMGQDPDEILQFIHDFFPGSNTTFPQTIDIDEVINRWKTLPPVNLAQEYIKLRYMIDGNGYVKIIDLIDEPPIISHLGFLSYQSVAIDEMKLKKYFRDNILPTLIKKLA